MTADPTPRKPRLVLTYRVNRDERVELERAAEREGVPLSTYIREAGLREARKPKRTAA